MHHFKTHLKFSSQCNYLANPQIWVDVERGWTIKRMEEGFRIRMEKGLFRRDMLTECLEDSGFPYLFWITFCNGGSILSAFFGFSL